MRRVVIGVIALSLLAVVPTAQAWGQVLGCARETDSVPWIWGGTVTCQQQADNVVIGSGTLNNDGCFAVFVSTGPQLTCVVNYSPGPQGDPANNRCAVSADDTESPWDCGTFRISIGPSAISLAGFGASAAPAGAVALGLAALAGLAVARRRRR